MSYLSLYLSQTKPYERNGQFVEAVYDRYNTEYNETFAEEAKPNSC